jgi:hypothetical protein
MGLRIFQYIINQGRREGEGEAATEDHVIKIRLPQARIIRKYCGNGDMRRIVSLRRKERCGMI